MKRKEDAISLAPEDSTPSQPHSTRGDLAVATDSLSRSYGSFVAVDAIDLAVPRGSFYGFLGPNGAGKSTTISCLTGLFRPTSGTIRVLGHDPFTEPVIVKRRIGVVPERMALLDRLTVAETLTFVGKVHGLAEEAIEERRPELLARMNLGDAAEVLVTDCSHGMRKKLALAAALLPGPELLFLDEPFEGIDAVASREIKNLLSLFVRRGGTIFLTSHILEVVERLCDHIGIIAAGKLVAQGSLAELRHAHGDAGLEDIFLELVGAPAVSEEREMDWLGKA